MGSTAKSPSHLEPTPHNDTLGKRVLETLIAWIGLSAPSQSRGWKGIGRTLRASLLICMALWAMAYEFSTNLNFFFSIRPKDTQIQIVEMVYGTKYMVKTLVTMSVLLLFLWKSSAIRALHDRLHRITNTLTVSTDCARNESLVAWVTIASFSFYMISHGTTRIYGVLGIKSLRPGDPIFPGLKVTALQEQCINLTLRNTTEAIRLLCSGYLGVFLIRLRDVLAAACSKRLRNLRDRGSEITRLELLNVWRDREAALSTVESISQDLGVLLSSIFMADILSLICCVGEALLVGNVLERIRLVGCILLYLTSMFAVGSGLIGLMDEDDKTQELVQKLQSAGVTHSLEGGPGLGRDGEKMSSSFDRGCVHLWSPFLSSCFGARKVAPHVSGFGHITRGTVYSVFGLLLTFVCFLLEQNNFDKRVDSTWQGTGNDTSS